MADSFQTVGILAVILPIVFILVFFGALYGFYVIKFRTKTATPNQALLVTGRNLGEVDKDPTVVKNSKGNYVKVVRGGVVRLKFQQFADKINLNSFQLSIGVEGIMVKGKDVINAEAKVQISVGDTNEHVLNYAEQFLGKSDSQIQKEIEEIITTHFRAILTTLTVEEINSNREQFNTKVSEIAKNDLDGLGFKISSFGLGRLEDSDKEGGYLSNSERQRKATMRKEAEIVESEAERETRIRKAEDEKLAKEMENQRAIEIAESNKLKAIEEAEIKKQVDKVQAEANAVKELEYAEQQKVIVEKLNEVELLKREGERKLAMVSAEEAKEVALKQADQRLAEEEKRQEQLRLETEKKAEMDKIRAVTKAEVEKTEADAQASVKIREAEAKAQIHKTDAEALAIAKERNAQAISKEKELEVLIEAKKLSEVGKAQAESIEAIGRAEALTKELESQVEAKRVTEIGRAEADTMAAKGRAEAETKDLMAEALLKIKDIHLRELEIKTAPLVASEIAKAIGAIGDVKIISTGGSEGQDVLTGSVGSSMLNNMALTNEILANFTHVGELAVNNSKKGQVHVNNYSDSKEAQVDTDSVE